MKKIILSMTILLALAGSLFANGLDNQNAIGMYILGGENAVGGIQYERRFSDLFSTKFGVFAFYNDKNQYSDPFNGSFTVEGDFTLFENTWKDKISSRLFAYGMIGYTGVYERNRSYDDNDNPIVTEKMHNNAITSVGFGFDFIFFDHLSVPIQFGFMGTFPDDPKIEFCGGVALRYTW